MDFPRCGGTDRVPIAPGYWECTSARTHRGYRPVPGPSSGPVPLQPHIETYTCGHRYSERNGATESAVGGACACGVFAIARCIECNQPLCGDHLTRRQGRVLCGDDAYRADVVACEAAFTAFLDRIAAVGAEGGHPVEVALRLLLVLRYAPKEGSYPHFGTGRQDSSTAIDRRDRVAAAVRAALPAHPWFDVNPASGWVRVSDPTAVAKWVFDSGRLPLSSMTVDRLVTFPTRRRKVVGSIPVAMVTPDRSWVDPETGRTTWEPGRRLLPNGRIYRGGQVEPGWETAAGDSNVE